MDSSVAVWCLIWRVCLSWMPRCDCAHREGKWPVHRQRQRCAPQTAPTSIECMQNMATFPSLSLWLGSREEQWHIIVTGVGVSAIFLNCGQFRSMKNADICQFNCSSKNQTFANGLCSAARQSSISTTTPFGGSRLWIRWLPIAFSELKMLWALGSSGSFAGLRLPMTTL